MNDDFDFDLSPDQWAALRTLRNPVANNRLAKAYLVDSLVKLGLVVIDDQDRGHAAQASYTGRRTQAPR